MPETIPPDLLGTQTLGLPRPPVDDDDEPVVMHEEFLTIVQDLRCGREGVAMLARLLQQSDDATLLAQGCAPGLATLLEGACARLDLAHDGLLGTAAALGIEVAL
ncbi:MAG: hypothetical protein C0423_13925 [Methylibium sp.]|nr:hypothetical protein [Methylibium sp.]